MNSQLVNGLILSTENEDAFVQSISLLENYFINECKVCILNDINDYTKIKDTYKLLNSVFPNYYSKLSKYLEEFTKDIREKEDKKQNLSFSFITFYSSRLYSLLGQISPKQPKSMLE